MTILTMGLLFCFATIFVLFSGVPITYALGIVSLAFMYFFMPAAALDTITKNVYEEMASITLLSIPLFILQGAAIGRSQAGRDLYRALEAWMYKIPGSLGVANVFACGLFAAMVGSSPACCSAIGSFGIPEMRKRGYSNALASGIIGAGGTLGILIPPSVTMILYAISAEQSVGRLFLAGIGPGIMLVILFSAYAMYRARKEYWEAHADFQKTGKASAYLDKKEYTLLEKLSLLPRILPFFILLVGVMIGLYGGYATPSETAGLGVTISFIMIAIIYRIWKPKDLAPILSSAVRESTMLLMIIGMTQFFSYVMAYLHISQSAAEWIVSLHLTKWVLLFWISLLMFILGFFLPPVSIIVMTTSIILPPLKDAGFDLIWFGVILTILLEMGLITPPVALNLFVIRNIAPDITINELVRGIIPFIYLMAISILLICIFPSIALAIPNYIMGVP